MPLTSFALSYLVGLANNGEAGRNELDAHCRTAGMDVERVLAEMRLKPDLRELVRTGSIETDVYPLSVALAKEFRNGAAFNALVADKLSLGADVMKDIGNVYCAALPAWMAAGLDDAYAQKIDIASREVLAVGYGSGDAAEAIPMRVAERWAEAAGSIAFRDTLEPYQSLSRTQYETLHDTGNAPDLLEANSGFIVCDVGRSATPGIHDEGIEYYRFLS